MKSFFIISLGILFFTSCHNKNESSSLDKALIQSFKDKDFLTLTKFFPTKAFYKSLGTEMAKRSDEEIDSFLMRSNNHLMESWKIVEQTIQEKKIDPVKIKIKETIVYNPFRENSMQAMVLLYEYDNKTWDDLTMIIKQQGDTTYLLEIPNPLRAFSFSDSSLSESSQARSAIDLKKPEFKQNLEKQVIQLIDWARNDNIEKFSDFVVYHGDDKNRSWKSAVNMEDKEESIMVINTMEKVKKALMGCTDFPFDKIQSERESEGYWIVQPVICNKKIIRFAFLKVKDKFLLGDINVEIQ